MAEVKGRLWPEHVPFGSSVLGADGKPLERGGVVCESRPGDFVFKDIDGDATRDLGRVDQMEYTCPRTGRYCGTVMVGVQRKPAESPSWNWDGNWENPTLTPSINCQGGCRWHGYLTAGVWKD